MSDLKGIPKYKEELIKNARYMVQKGKGILASDESTGTIGKRLATINVENTEENRRHYRELLYTCPELEKYISGAILYDETVYQKTKEGKRFTELLTSRGILPGIKVDKGTIPIINSENETLTQGLDDLGKRCAKYYEEGCRFAKWRSVLRIILYTIVDTMLWCITIWGSLMLVLVLLGKFTSKTDEEIE
jgi:fructose-bisphosphate aldolase class I